MNANDTMGQHGLWRSMAQLDSTGGGDSTKSGQRSGMSTGRIYFWDRQASLYVG